MGPPHRRGCTAPSSIAEAMEDEELSRMLSLPLGAQCRVESPVRPLKPLRISGEPTLNLILTAAGVFGWVVLFKIIYAARERIARPRVIKRDLTGQKYDSKKHDTDHVWLHSRGRSRSPNTSAHALEAPSRLRVDTTRVPGHQHASPT